MTVNDIMEDNEKPIGDFFNKESKSMVKRHDEKGIPITAQQQIDDIVNSGSKTVIDVGSGPGSVMIGLLDGGIEHVTGIDLAEEMNALAKMRLVQKGFDEGRFSIKFGSFLKYDFDDVDAVSLHRVLCCHPNRDELLNKAVELNPKVISLTVPRNWLFFRFVTAIFAGFAKLKGSFRPYIHSQAKIDKILINSGYQIDSRSKGRAWVKTTYIKTNPS